MCCLIAALMVFGPRVGILLWWLIDQTRWERAFDNFLWAFLGFIFLPWTTIFYVLVAPDGRVTGFDWFWLAIGLMADLSSYASSRYRRGFPSRSAAV